MIPNYSAISIADYLTKKQVNQISLTKVVSQTLERLALDKQLLKYQQKEQIISDITLRIREHIDIEGVLDAIVKEVKDFLEADRVIIYKFKPDFNGVIVAEAVNPPWTASLNQEIIDTCFNINQGSIYSDGNAYMLSDIYQAGRLITCYQHILL